MEKFDVYKTLYLEELAKEESVEEVNQTNVPILNVAEFDETLVRDLNKLEHPFLIQEAFKKYKKESEESKNIMHMEKSNKEKVLGSVLNNVKLI